MYVLGSGKHSRYYYYYYYGVASTPVAKMFWVSDRFRVVKASSVCLAVRLLLHNRLMQPCSSCPREKPLRHPSPANHVIIGFLGNVPHDSKHHRQQDPLSVLCVAFAWYFRMGTIFTLHVSELSMTVRFFNAWKTPAQLRGL